MSETGTKAKVKDKLDCTVLFKLLPSPKHKELLFKKIFGSKNGHVDWKQYHLQNPVRN